MRTSFLGYEVKQSVNEQYPVPPLPELHSTKARTSNNMARHELDAIIDEFEATSSIGRSQELYEMKVTKLRQSSDVRKSQFQSKRLSLGEM
ncbi:hypothetical protein SS50377_20363 [Spironucleus salmonicida]|uniref:Uncharacterized protein n=1 Tax=Spironucleus salmonicida TaxID=348837 RepID=V6LFH1_9EUKA|nr:hypothetical protein SS50377_20363 [Spironucleus salmonicida]|eukprot:EST43043.1 Hypothetical protein SS50377_17345 [Spironucleus salmonicida]